MCTVDALAQHVRWYLTGRQRTRSYLLSGVPQRTLLIDCQSGFTKELTWLPQGTSSCPRNAARIMSNAWRPWSTAASGCAGWTVSRASATHARSTPSVSTASPLSRQSCSNVSRSARSGATTSVCARSVPGPAPTPPSRRAHTSSRTPSARSRRTFTAS